MHKFSQYGKIKWLKLDEYPTTEADRIDITDIQGVVIFVNVVPGDTFFIRIEFREELEVDPSQLQYWYKSHITAHVSQRGSGLEGLIESPNYPNYYPDKADIKWLVRLPANRNFGVSINIEELETEQCCDVLTLYDGALSNATALVHLSGSLSNYSTTQFTTTGPDALIEFTSDSSNDTGYFSFTFSSFHFALVPACSGQEILASSEGSIASSNYPINYPENARCDWIIVTPPRTTVVLEIVDFNLNDVDYVIVFDRSLTGVTELARLFGTIPQTTIYGNTNSMELAFHSDYHLLAMRGFLFQYSAKHNPEPCNGGVVLEDSTGEISSSLYPLSYLNNLTCTWQIRVSNGSVVHITIDDFQTEGNYDYLEIYDGPDSNSTLLAKLSGTTGQESSQITSQNYAFLRFVSDFDITYRGFHLTYEEYAISTSCSVDMIGIVDGQQGYISTPNYPKPFPSFSRCSWVITVDYATIATMKLVELDLGHKSGNTLRIYDGSSNSSRVLYKGNEEREAMYINATQNEVLVELDTKNNSEYRGFLLRFKQLDLTKYCMATNIITSPQGQLSSPLYPGYYPSGYSCGWVIVTPTLTKVNLVVKEFQTDSLDTLVAYDGEDSFDPVLFTCYGTVCNVVPSSSDHMYLVFTTKSSNVGFSFEFYGTSDTCNGSQQLATEKSTSGFVISPFYPQNYHNDMSCQWLVTVIPIEFIQITVDKIATETCCDWLRIYDGDSRNSPPLLETSGHHEIEMDFSTTGYQAFIAFDVDNSVNDQGFTLSYVGYLPKSDNEGSGSGDEVYQCTAYDDIDPTINRGYILSPGYSTNYENGLDYCWQLGFAINNFAIDLTFSRIETEQDHDVIQVFKGLNADGEHKVAELSGYIITYSIRVMSDTATVLFHTDAFVTDKGFILEYNAVQ